MFRRQSWVVSPFVLASCRRTLRLARSNPRSATIACHSVNCTHHTSEERTGRLHEIPRNICYLTAADQLHLVNACFLSKSGPRGAPASSAPATQNHQLQQRMQSTETGVASGWRRHSSSSSLSAVKKIQNTRWTDEACQVTRTL